MFRTLAALALSLTLAFPAHTEELDVTDVDYGSKFGTIFERIRAAHPQPDKLPPPEIMLKIAVEAMLRASGDKHGSYMTQQELDAFNEHMRPTAYGGVGIGIAPTPLGLMITQIFDNSPLRAIPLHVGDVILAAAPNLTDDFVVYDTQNVGQSARAVIGAIRGPSGTSVRLKVKREGLDLGIIVVERVTARDQTVYTKLDDDGILSIRIGKFSATVLKDLLDQLHAKGIIENYHPRVFDYAAKPPEKPGELPSNLTTDDLTDDSRLKDELLPRYAGNLKGILIDVRSNPGGALHIATALLDAFLPKETALVGILTQGVNNIQQAGYPPLFPESLPVAVVVNGGSASASEVLAGGLKQHKRAYLFGTKTFGKGSVQSVMRNDGLGGGGAVKATSALYLAGGEMVIDGVGIQPNQKVPQPSTYGTGSVAQNINTRIILSSMDPEIDHQYHYALNFLRWFDGKEWTPEHIVQAFKAAETTQTIVDQVVCTKKKLKGCEPTHPGM